MNRKNPTTIDAINNTNTLGRHNLGGGLHILVGKNGSKTFKLRTYVEGKDKWITLGKFPEMNPDQAWEKTKELQFKLDQAIQNKREADFTARLDQISTRKNLLPHDDHQAFANMDEAGQFIRKLFETDSNDPLIKEIRLAVWLQMLLPSRANELISAKQAHFDFKSLMWKTPKRRGSKSHDDLHEKFYVSVLSQYAIDAIHELLDLTAPDNSEGYLLPLLRKMTANNRNTLINEELQKIWPNSIISPDEFWILFRNEAHKLSFYRHEFVTEMLLRSDGDGAIFSSNLYYANQRRELANWWGNYLMNLRNSVMEKQINYSELTLPSRTTSLFQPLQPTQKRPDRWTQPS